MVFECDSDDSEDGEVCNGGNMSGSSIWLCLRDNLSDKYGHIARGFECVHGVLSVSLPEEVGPHIEDDRCQYVR
jgi:hypothetical protein